MDVKSGIRHMDIKAIILAGGLGTRLRHLVPGIPKVMAPVNGKPFLNYVLDQLQESGVSAAVLAVGHMASVIENAYGSEYKGMKLSYSFEDKPLGTGGAIKKAFNHIKDDRALIINGDTYSDISIQEMHDFHVKRKSKLTIAVKKMNHISRFGLLDVKDGIVEAFWEKQYAKEGIINRGVYIIEKKVMEDIVPEKFSIEKDVFEKNLVPIHAYESDGYFIDIGVPDDYHLAQKEFPPSDMV